MKRSSLIFENIQIKSEECFHRFAKAVQEIEEQTGIHSVNVIFKNIFFCPWINIDKCKQSPMEKLLMRIIVKLEVKK